MILRPVRIFLPGVPGDNARRTIQREKRDKMDLNILIVDDSQIMRTMIKKTLNMSGIPIGEFLEAANGEEGLALLRGRPIHLAIVDINMPVMNGEAMVGRMKADEEMSQIPVIIVSTEGSQTRIERLKGQGVYFVRKPFSPETIRDTIKSIQNLDM